MTMALRSVDPPSRVDELADIANSQHLLVIGAARTGLEHALAAGAALNEAKANFDGDSWTAWMKEHLAFHHTTANWYMRVDHFRAELAAANDVGSFKDAIRFLRKHEMRVRDTLGATQLQAIYALLDEGLGQTEIAARVGISKQGVHHHKVRRAQREQTAIRPPAIRPPAPRGDEEITDDLIEAVADWLCAYLHRFGHPQNVTDQVRADALQLLNRILCG